MRPRLLPITIVVVALLLTSKVATLSLAFVPGVSMSSAVVSVAEAAPANEGEGKGKEGAHGAAAPPPTKPPEFSTSAYAKPTISAPVEPSAPPQPVISEAEKKLLGDLRSRRDELDAREHTLTEREGVLKAAEERLSARVAQLTALQTRLEALEKERTDHDEANWTGLVKVYEAMKPREAAAIFNEMEMPTLLHVLDRMKDSKAALVLGAMQPDRARLATTQLAAQRTRSTTLPPEHPTAG
jgi:flagellar motility protein MotE (MotC chaperone)